MKCPKCGKDMQKKQATPSVWYFECPNCHYTLGKPEEITHEEEQRTSEEVSNG